MPGLEAVGRWLVIGGLTIALLGGLIWLAARLFAGISQFPGTIRFQSGPVTCIFPLLASVIFSIVLTILLNLVSRLFGK